jgi:DNA polymerase I-like protein with 3'-5' exonuclease and polymerase domains
VDAEWGYRDDRIGWESRWQFVVMCLVNLDTGRRLVFRKEDIAALRDFFRDHRDDLFIAHGAQAEMKVLLRLGIAVPPNWFCTLAGWRLLKNKPGKQGYKVKLTDCLHEAGQPHMAPAEKEKLRDDILHLRVGDTPEEQRRIAAYCASDCVGAAALFLYLQPRVSAAWMAAHGHYLLAVARMELRGIAFDLTTYDALQDAAPAMLKSLRDEVNRTWLVYDGETFKRRQFFEWCGREGIDWPEARSRTTGKLYKPLDDDTMKAMEDRHSFIKTVRQVRKTHKHLGKRTMVVDRGTGRHYYDTWPLSSVTGRNQPTGFVFGGPKYQRLLMRPESPDHLLVYADGKSEEFNIAAARSQDPEMLAACLADDPYMELAIANGAAPPGATAKTHPHIRAIYKVCQLALLYGATAFGISRRLGISFRAAEQIEAQFRARYRVFVAWRERHLNAAYERGVIATPCGWRSKVPVLSNERTWMNWPIQSIGADILRAAATYLDRQNVRLLGLVHDAFLISCRRDQLADLREALDYAFGLAVEHSLPGYRIRCDMHAYEHRFWDKDGAPMWDLLMGALYKTTPATGVLSDRPNMSYLIGYGWYPRPFIQTV